MREEEREELQGGGGGQLPVKLLKNWNKKIISFEGTNILFFYIKMALKATAHKVVLK